MPFGIDDAIIATAATWALGKLANTGIDTAVGYTQNKRVTETLSIVKQNNASLDEIKRTANKAQERIDSNIYEMRSALAKIEQSASNAQNRTNRALAENMDAHAFTHDQILILRREVAIYASILAALMYRNEIKQYSPVVFHAALSKLNSLAIHGQKLAMAGASYSGYAARTAGGIVGAGVDGIGKYGAIAGSGLQKATIAAYDSSLGKEVLVAYVSPTLNVALLNYNMGPLGIKNLRHIVAISSSALSYAVTYEQKGSHLHSTLAALKTIGTYYGTEAIMERSVREPIIAYFKSISRDMLTNPSVLAHFAASHVITSLTGGIAKSIAGENARVATELITQQAITLGALAQDVHEVPINGIIPFLHSNAVIFAASSATHYGLTAVRNSVMSKFFAYGVK